MGIGLWLDGFIRPSLRSSRASWQPRSAAALYRVNPVPTEVLVFFFIPKIEALVSWLLPEASVDRRAEIANGYILPAPVNQEVDTCEGKETVEPGKVSD